MSDAKVRAILIALGVCAVACMVAMLSLPFSAPRWATTLCVVGGVSAGAPVVLALWVLGGGR